MTQEEYEQKRRECWEEYKRKNLDGEPTNSTCGGCDLAKFHCCLADYCIEYGCHFRYSPELTEKLNE